MPQDTSAALGEISLVWAPDEQSLATVATLYGTQVNLPVQIWNLQTGQLQMSYTQHTAQPSDIVWVDGGKEIVSSSTNEVLLWNVTTGQTVLKISNNASINVLEDSMGEQFSLNGRFLVGPVDAGAQIVDLDTGKIVRTIHINGALLGAILSSDGTRLATINYAGQIQIWNVQSGQMELTYTLPGNFQDGSQANNGLGPVSLTWSADGTMLAVSYVNGNGRLVVLNTAS